MFKSFIEKITSLFSKVFAFGAGASMFSLFLIIFVNSIRRYAFGKSFEWGEELPVFLAIYGVMFGIAWAYMNDQHVRFTILVDFISEKFAKFLNMIVDLSMIATGSLLCYSGYQFAAKRGIIESSGMIGLAKDLVEATGIESLIIFGKMFPYQLAISIGGVMLVIAALLRFLNRFFEKSEDKVLEG